MSLKDRRGFLHNAYEVCIQIENDSIRANELFGISFQTLNLLDSTFFKFINKEAQITAISLKDNFLIANIDWNYGAYYFQYEILDSAYVHYKKAYEKFETLNRFYYSAKMLYNMAVIQKDIKDYTGSEILTFQAIQKFEGLDRPLNLYLCYNLLGVLFNEMKEYQKGRILS